VADADVDASNRTRIRRDEYQAYIISGFADISGYWRDEKTAICNQYWPHDPS
jgi:hypothetical protein